LILGFLNLPSSQTLSACSPCLSDNLRLRFKHADDFIGEVTPVKMRAFACFITRRTKPIIGPVLAASDALVVGPFYSVTACDVRSAWRTTCPVMVSSR
jgi:hypothetical protein